MSKTRVYGMQLIVDGYEGEFSHLRSESRVSQYLSMLPSIIDMEIVQEARVTTFHPKNNKLEWGCSGSEIIMEPAVIGNVGIETSHIAIHTWPRLGIAAIDIFSCRKFDGQVALAFTKDWFGFEYMDFSTLDRIKMFPNMTEGPE